MVEKKQEPYGANAIAIYYRIILNWKTHENFECITLVLVGLNEVFSETSQLTVDPE